MSNRHHPSEPAQALLIDLDDTLYYCPEMSKQVAKNIQCYMVEHLGVSAHEVEEVSYGLYKSFGTTLAGLVHSGYSIDYHHWHDHVHGTLDYEKYLKPDPALKTMLNSIPVPKYVFTNADLKHAERCLNILGLEDCFRDVICFETIMDMWDTKSSDHMDAHKMSNDRGGVMCKPHPKAMELALEHAGVRHPGLAVFFDDSARNITSAHKSGVHSILVNPNRIDCSYHSHIRTIHDVPHQLSWLTSVGDGCPPTQEGVLASVGEALEAEETPLSVRA